MGNHTRKERRFLHFCSSNRTWALAQHRALAKGIQNKLMPAFSDIESEADAFAEWEYKWLSSLPGADGDFNMGEIAEMAIDRSVERYQDLAFVEGQLRALAIAGLYHLWERTLKEFLVRTLGWEGHSKTQIDKIHRSNFHELIDTLEKFGFLVKEECFFDDLNIVRVVANTCKHGEGQAFEELANKAPELLRGRYRLESRLLSPPHPENFWIDAQRFANLERAIEQFWHAMPERLLVPETRS